MSAEYRFDYRLLFTRKTAIELAIIGVLVLALYGFSSPINWSGPVRATVVDEETGKPIAGAAVAGVWWVGGLNGPTNTIMHRSSAVTNGKGEFVLRGMFPRPRLPLTWYSVHDPDIHIYAPGYQAVSLDNYPFVGGYRGRFDWRSARRRSFWDGRAIPLKRVRTHDEALQSLSDMHSYVDGDDFKVNDFPDLWLRMEAGWNQLPSDVQARSTFGDPSIRLANWKSRNR
jgi:hypothetical protein